LIEQRQSLLEAAKKDEGLGPARQVPIAEREASVTPRDRTQQHLELGYEGEEDLGSAPKCLRDLRPVRDGSRTNHTRRGKKEKSTNLKASAAVLLTGNASITGPLGDAYHTRQAKLRTNTIGARQSAQLVLSIGGGIVGSGVGGQKGLAKSRKSGVGISQPASGRRGIRMRHDEGRSGKKA
jgi:hypothetical protein